MMLLLYSSDEMKNIVSVQFLSDTHQKKIGSFLGLLYKENVLFFMLLFLFFRLHILPHQMALSYYFYSHHKKATSFSTKTPNHWKPLPTRLALSPLSLGLGSASRLPYATPLWQSSGGHRLNCKHCKRDHEDQ